MNKTIKALNKQLLKTQGNISKIEEKLQLAYNSVFDKSNIVKKMISKVENSSDYTFMEYGEIASYASVDLSDFQECKQYFEHYMNDSMVGFIEVDWTNDCLTMSQGESLIIQDDMRNDNGVWLNGKCVIDEVEYKEGNEVDEVKRNELIEAYMEKNGYFPGVFRADSHGNVFLVNTQEKKSA